MTTKLPSLQPYDLHWAVQRLPKAVAEALKKHPNRMIIAGGYIRSIIANEPINDIDIFSPSEEAAKILAESMTKDGKKVIETDNAFTVTGHKIPLQFIHRWTYDDPEKVVGSFDFTIARAAFWFDGFKWKSVCDESFYADLAAKRLIYCSPVRNEDAGGSLLRVLKFYQRGYRIPLHSMGAVIARLVHGIEPSHWREVQGYSKIDGENRMAFLLSGLLREVDPLVDPDHIAHFPDVPEPSTQPETPAN